MNKKQVDVKPVGQSEQAGCGELPKSRVLRMLQCSFLCNVNETRALIGLCLLVTLHLGQMRDPWHDQAFIVTNIVIGLSRVLARN